jgi:hypothetical protein
MVPFETMRIRLAKTVVKLVTENTTALNSATLQPTSSVVSVEMQVTWLEIVPIGMDFLATLEIGKC